MLQSRKPHIQVRGGSSDFMIGFALVIRSRGGRRRRTSTTSPNRLYSSTCSLLFSQDPQTLVQSLIMSASKTLLSSSPPPFSALVRHSISLSARRMLICQTARRPSGTPRGRSPLLRPQGLLQAYRCQAGRRRELLLTRTCARCSRRTRSASVSRWRTTLRSLSKTLRSSSTSRLPPSVLSSLAAWVLGECEIGSGLTG